MKKLMLSLACTLAFAVTAAHAAEPTAPSWEFATQQEVLTDLGIAPTGDVQTRWEFATQAEVLADIAN